MSFAVICRYSRESGMVDIICFVYPEYEMKHCSHCRDDMRNSFNLLLISLLCIDTWYLLGSVLESFRRCFDIYHQLHIIVFPYLLYPLQSVAMSASIFMTVGIALERYIAVHYPIGKRNIHVTPVTHHMYYITTEKLKSTMAGCRMVKV